MLKYAYVIIHPDLLRMDMVYTNCLDITISNSTFRFYLSIGFYQVCGHLNLYTYIIGLMFHSSSYFGKLFLELLSVHVWQIFGSWLEVSGSFKFLKSCLKLEESRRPRWFRYSIEQFCCFHWSSSITVLFLIMIGTPQI